MKGKVLDLDSLMKPVSVYCEGTVLFVVEMMTDKFVTTYDIPTKKRLSCNISHGEGPNESLSCFALQVDRQDVVVLDAMKKEAKVFSFKDFVSSNDVQPVSKIEFENIPFWVARTPQKEIVSTIMADEQSLLTKYDSTGKKMNLTLDYPDKSNSQSDWAKKFSYKNRVYYNAEQKKFVVSYMYTDIFDIYDEDLNLLHRVQGPDCFLPQMVDDGDAYVPTDNAKLSFQNCSLTSDKIWLLYIGLTFEEDDNGDGLYDKIFVFDYNGHPVKYFRLDIPVSWICVNEESKTIFGISDCPERSVVEFKYE